MLRKFLLLTGLSGAGKSTVAALLAAKLDRAGLDLDDVIAARAGMSVADLFETEGEACFRRLEAEALADALSGPPAVIAAGGGALVNEASRRLALENATVVWLRVSPARAAARCARSEARPLLAGGAEEALSRLLKAREAGYAEAHLAVDTDGRDAAAVASEILTRLEAA